MDQEATQEAKIEQLREALIELALKVFGDAGVDDQVLAAEFADEAIARIIRPRLEERK